MDPILQAVLLSWNWRLEVIAVLALAGTLYMRGWWRLRGRTHQPHKQSHRRLVRRWRLVAYVTGLFFIALALLSPIDVLGQQLFLMHMIQHLLLIMVAPPLLLIANPMPFILWGLPGNGRYLVGRRLSRLLHRQSAFRRGWRAVTTPGIVWLWWTISLIGWHDSQLYSAALESELLHNVEHLSFFLASLLFWWHITGAGPRIHKQFGLIGRIALVLSAVPPNMFIGVAIALAPDPIYRYYLQVPRLWQISVITDQQIGGVIMWIPGSMMYMITALILISRLVQGESDKPVLPESKWGTDDALSAPGLKK